MLSKNVPFWYVPAHIFETRGWNNITFGSQGDIGIIHSFLDFDLVGMAPCDLELLGGGLQQENHLASSLFTKKTSGGKVGYCQSLPSDFVLGLLGLALVFIDECNPSKIFKMASNSLEVRDVPF